MLTKDLLKFHLRKGEVQPDFVAVEDESLLALAEQLIGFYTQEGEIRRGHLDEEIEEFLRTCRPLAVAKGFNKLLQDRCEFAHTDETDHPARRAGILQQAAELLADGGVETPTQFRQMVTGSPGRAELYADLPANERLVKFRSLTARQLLQRYNVAQVQGLLFSAGSLTLHTRNENAANLRRAFKFLKFFRLLARIYKEDDDSLRVEIDGPLSIVKSARKYGLQLASFFPAVCHLKTWQIEAAVTVKKRDCRLLLDQETGLVSHYRNLSAYVPEEVLMFAKHFEKKGRGWKLTRETPFISMDSGEIIFPDFTFENESGERVYLELFHRWHRGALLPRLRYCIAKGEGPLFIGIDKALYKGELKDLLETGVLPEHRFFTFRDYPTVTKVQKCLDGYSTSPPELFDNLS